jgi:hypothetical protein
MLLIHDSTDDEEQLKRYTKREKEWLSFVKGWYTNSNKDCSREKLTLLLRDLQEYIVIDYPKSDILPDDALLRIADNVARIAIWFADTDCNNYELEYPRSKLTEIFVHLFSKYKFDY